MQLFYWGPLVKWSKDTTYMKTSCDQCAFSVTRSGGRKRTTKVTNIGQITRICLFGDWGGRWWMFIFLRTRHFSKWHNRFWSEDLAHHTFFSTRSSLLMVVVGKGCHIKSEVFLYPRRTAIQGKNKLIIFTARNSSCGKVMFSQAWVIYSVHGGGRCIPSFLWAITGHMTSTI